MNNLDVKGIDKGEVPDSFTRDIAEFFGTYEHIYSIERADIEAMQLAVLKKRFNNLRNGVAVLKKLADKQGVDEMKHIDDAVPLLFSHTIYKTYPISFLEKNRFKQMNQWLSKLTTIDISNADVSACQGIDDWIQTMEKQTPLKIRHTSGTGGMMSFIPRTIIDDERYGMNLMFLTFEVAGLPHPTRDKPLSMHVIFPTYRSGNYGAIRMHGAYVQYIAGGDESKVHSLYPRHQSSDLLFLGGRLRAAKASGELDRLELTPALLARKAEFEAIQQNMPNDLQKFLNDMIHNLKGERIYATVTSNHLFNVAAEGLSKGAKNVFAPESILLTGGGSKGQVMPDDWKETVKQFFGVKEIVHAYATSEVTATHMLCSHNRYHVSPECIFYVLDPETSAPLPRKGVQTGRAAFFDLIPESYWGGFVSGDEVTVDWDTQCGCGKKSAHLSMDIGRVSDKRGGEDKISCAAASEAHDEALDFLMQFS